MPANVGLSAIVVELGLSDINVESEVVWPGSVVA